jgi:hypothetical protein
MYTHVCFSAEQVCPDRRKVGMKRIRAVEEQLGTAGNSWEQLGDE